VNEVSKWLNLAIFILEAIQKAEGMKGVNKKKEAMKLTDDMIITSGFLTDDKLLSDFDVVKAKSDAIEALVKFENILAKPK